MWSIQLYHNMDFWGILIQCHKDLVKIVRWDLSNYHALKAGWKTVETHFCCKGDQQVTIQTSGHISAELVRILCHEVIGNWAEPSSDLMTTSRSSCTQWFEWFPKQSEPSSPQLHRVVWTNPEAGRYGVVTRNDRRRPWKSWSTRWGWNFFALKKKQLGTAYRINIQYKLLDFLYSCFVLLEPGYANIILPQAPFAYNVGR